MADGVGRGLHVERAVPYGCDKQLDIYHGSAPASAGLLLWHGTGGDERDVLEPLARATAALGVTVFVPDWRSDAADRGRAHLLTSLGFFVEHAVDIGADPARLSLAGWSRGGTEAAAVAMSPPLVAAWRPCAVACVSGAFREAAAMTGRPPLDDAREAIVSPVPVWLVHGIRDTTRARRAVTPPGRTPRPARLARPPGGDRHRARRGGHDRVRSRARPLPAGDGRSRDQGRSSNCGDPRAGLTR